jgi:hypothetical protein
MIDPSLWAAHSNGLKSVEDGHTLNSDQGYERSVPATCSRESQTWPEEQPMGGYFVTHRLKAAGTAASIMGI